MVNIALAVYEGFTSLDVVGPFEVLSRLPHAKVHFVSTSGGPIAADQPHFALSTEPLADHPTPDIIVVSGGSTTQSHLADQALTSWLRNAHETTQWTTSVCTGSLLLGAAGLLRSRRATSHWYELESLRTFGAHPTNERVVIDGRLVTAAGVSAGIDMALTLCDLTHGPAYAQSVQLAIEYDPEPPHDAGSLASAPSEIADLVRNVFRDHYGPTWSETQNGASVTATRPS